MSSCSRSGCVRAPTTRHGRRASKGARCAGGGGAPHMLSLIDPVLQVDGSGAIRYGDGPVGVALAHVRDLAQHLDLRGKRGRRGARPSPACPADRGAAHAAPAGPLQLQAARPRQHPRASHPVHTNNTVPAGQGCVARSCWAAATYVHQLGAVHLERRVLLIAHVLRARGCAGRSACLRGPHPGPARSCWAAHAPLGATTTPPTAAGPARAHPAPQPPHLKQVPDRHVAQAGVVAALRWQVR